MRKMKHLKKLILSAAAAVLALSLAGCHGSKAGSDFKMPDSFDDTEQIEIVFWAKNDTNQTQTEIYRWGKGCV